MYLEMLYNRYGAELEKQAMEKQALSPMKLLLMGRRFAARDKMDRFAELLAKRNRVIKNTDVFAKRQMLADDLAKKSEEEFKWLHRSGPVDRRWARAYDRSPLIYSTKDLHRMLKQDINKFLYYTQEGRPSKAIGPHVLAEWSSKLNQGL